MIQDFPAHWSRLCRLAEDIGRQARVVEDRVNPELFPHDQQDIDHVKEPLLDLRDIVNQLEAELTWLGGYIDAGGVQGIERPNERGDWIIDITPNTAPVSEIAKSLRSTIPKVNGAIRRLGIEPAGWVHWRLADGSEPEPAGTYNLAQWKQLKFDLYPLDNAQPPARLMRGNDTSHSARPVKGQ